MNPNETRRVTGRAEQTPNIPATGPSRNAPNPPNNPQLAPPADDDDPLPLARMIAQAIAIADRDRTNPAGAGEALLAPQPYRYSIASQDNSLAALLLRHVPPGIRRSVLDPDELRFPVPGSFDVVGAGIALGGLREDGRAFLPNRPVLPAGGGGVTLIRSRVGRTPGRRQYYHPGLNEWRDLPVQSRDQSQGDNEAGGEETPKRKRRRDKVRRRVRRVMVAIGIMKKKDKKDDDDVGGAMGRLNISLPLPGSMRGSAFRLGEFL